MLQVGRPDGFKGKAIPPMPSIPSMSLFSSDWKLDDDVEDASFNRLDDVRGKPDGCGAEWNNGKWKPPSTYIHTYNIAIVRAANWYCLLM